MSIQQAVTETRLLSNSWREEPSVVTAVKKAYRYASKAQRRQLRTWMRQVLSNVDSTK